MNRKIFYIVFIALAIVLLVALLWWWFLRREGESIQTTGTFGTAQNAGQTTTGGSSDGQTNIGTTLPGSGSDQNQTNVQLGNAGGQNPNGVVTQGGVVVSQAQGQVGVPGVVWLSGVTPASVVLPNGGPVSLGGPVSFGDPNLSTSTIVIGTSSVPVVTTGTVTVTPITNTPGTVFNPTDITQIVGSNPSGTGLIPNIPVGSNGQQVSNGGLGLAGTAAIGVAAGALACGAAQGIRLALAGIGITLETGKATAAQSTAAATGAATAAISVSTVNVGLSAQTAAQAVGTASALGAVSGGQAGDFQVDKFLGCIARTIAKVALNQITNSVVNWINSGFKGSPSFIQNPTRFFNNVADQAAGTFIQGSALSFLCSPFQLQIKIAIAQSYANRNANSCTLTKVVGNVQNFMRGNFLSGNWAGLLSFTNVPTNNPYGAFLYAQAGLSLSVQTAKGQQQIDLLQGQGFLSFKQKQNCRNVSANDIPGAGVGPGKTMTELPGPIQPGQPIYYEVCDEVTTTPGKAIENSLNAATNNVFSELNMAKNFDEIINALITQLVTRMLQGGLSNLSGPTGYASNFYTADQLTTQAQAQTLLAQMQDDTANAGSYAQIQQGSIMDIQNTQGLLNELYNCWNNIAHASSSTITGAVRDQAAQNANTASSTLYSLNGTVDIYNNHITMANQAIIFLQDLQSSVLSAQSTSELSSISGQYSAAKATGQIPTKADITNAQQNRTTLQGQMSTINTQTTTGLQQCNAIF